MIAKFHSAPGHSMETTLTINIPPPDRLRAAKGERLREKQKEKDKEGGDAPTISSKLKDRDKEAERMRRDMEKDEESIKKEEKEREKLERERRALPERGVSYKDKFQKLREKYDKVINTHETSFQDLSVLNAKIKKLQAENDLLLDAVFLADTALYDHYFPSGPGRGSPPIGHPPQQHVPQAPVLTTSPVSYHVSKHGHGHIPYAKPPHQQGMSGLPLPPGSRYVEHPSAYYERPPMHEYAHGRSGHGQNHYPSHYRHRGQHEQQPLQQHHQQKPHPFYVYPPREPVPPELVQPPVHHPGHPSQHSGYGGYGPAGHHHGMLPPPPPPIPMGIEAERERLGREWERDRARVRDRDRAEREWEMERDQRERYASGQDPAGMPPSAGYGPGGVGITHSSSNGYNSTAPNGHARGHGHAHGHGHSAPSVPPPSMPPHGRRASRSRSSRSESRRREDVMDVDNTGGIPLKASPSPDADVDMTLGGPVHLGEDLEAARERGRRGSLHREGAYSRRVSVERGRRSESQTPTLSQAHPHPYVVRPMGAVEPGSVPVGIDASSHRPQDPEERQSPTRGSTSKPPSTGKSNLRENFANPTSDTVNRLPGSEKEARDAFGGELERDAGHRRTRSQTQRYGSGAVPLTSSEGHGSRRKTRRSVSAKVAAVAPVVASPHEEEEGGEEEVEEETMEVDGDGREGQD